jgi:protoporphyrinogen oxidase
MKKYKEIIIIGGGVAGLAFANEAIKKYPEANIKIFEKDKTLGGCHKVDRKKFNEEYYFCEHAPRIYINNYINFINLLKSMKLDFYKLFGKYK